MKYLLMIILICICTQAQNSLQEAIDSYYKSLDAQAEEASSNTILKNAYESFARIPVLDDFLLYNTAFENKGEAKTIREQNKSRRGFFYPASLYDNYETLLLSFNELKMTQLEQEIKTLERELQDIVAEQSIQKKALLTLDKVVEDLKSKNNALEREIIESKKIISTLEQNSAEADRRISLIRSDIRRALDEELKLIAIIRRLDVEIIREIDEIKKSILISRRNTLERQRRGLQAEATDLQHEFERLNDAISRAEVDISKFSRNLPGLQSEQQKIAPKLEELSQQKTKVEEKLEEYEEQLKPLAILKEQEQKITVVTNEYQEWWKQANKRPKHHLLLALYVLHKYSKENYKIEVKEWYGLDGIVEIYFW